MCKHEDAREQIEAWIRGVLAQVTNREAARQSAALHRQIVRPYPDEERGLDELGTLLLTPLRALDARHPIYDAMLIRESVFGLMQHHLAAGTSPSQAETDHAVDFCLRAVFPALSPGS